MNLLAFFAELNLWLSLPTAFILLVSAAYLTVKLSFIQIRKIPYFFHLIAHGVPAAQKNIRAINPLYALFTAMSTSIGMGTIVGPSVAIIMGGPGALFWLIFYAICGAVLKYAEVTFAIQYREKTSTGRLLGGPMQYLQQISPYLGLWYAIVTMFLFAGWSGLQANVLAETLAQEYLPQWITGVTLAIFVFIMLRGGSQRIGAFNSKLVPVMFVLYVTAAVTILFNNAHLIIPACRLIFAHLFKPTAIAGGVLGSSIFGALCAGTYKGAFITESGMGTSSIPHALADVEKPTDQAVLAMTSVFVDTFLCLLSGLLVLITNLWQETCVRNTIIYQVFEMNFPTFGRPILIGAIIMFVLGTIIGNSFNGRQSFATVTNGRWQLHYYLFVCLIIFFGAISNVPLIWAIMEIMLPLVAIPNVLSIVYLSTKKREILGD